MAQFIYTMQKVRKAHGDKVILDDVTLSFLPGAKIGVVGPNGAGKSTVLRIMAGLDHASNGDATLAAGATVGMLQQEPPLDDTKTVRENVEDAVVELRGILARFDEVSADFRIDPTAVIVGRSSAMGAGLGLSMDGIFDTENYWMDFQGVLSPFYLLNGIGSILTRPGEGLLGFNFTMRGDPDDPSVGVNPLSVLTPGMFREIFRRAPPDLGQ